MRKSLIALLLICSGGAAVAATAADVITARQHNYKQIGRAFKGVMDELKAPSPSVPTIQANAKTIAALAPQLPTWFPAGSGPEAGVKTAALPAIWQRNAEFRKDAADLAQAARALDVAAGTGNLDQIRPAAQALGGACKACHENFRAKD